ncbi:hypothetical protein A4H97_31275 [Niastella yeongjuensis]|uniref:Iron dicitrate transport regulator FecR n=2 Tax=Niastella yeongjuensis TaxID=354355 RepID=A0A1V9EJE0_9BACT|nr:hypothetical protein A4H97_31275 [Niastella yeongjuensis]
MAELVHKHMTGSLSGPDSIELNQILTDPAKRKLFEELTDWHQTRAQVKIMSEGKTRVSWRQIEAAYPFHNKWYGLKKYLAAAAVILPVAGVVAWYFYAKPAQEVIPTVAPGPAQTQFASYHAKSQKAVWKRAAGLAVFLDELKNGVIGYADGEPVIKNDSELVYPAARRSNTLLTDTLQTLRGGYYRLQLPDGSKVVLNSASTVLFASTSGSSERRVSVIGEAYFEVVKDRTRPFYVRVPGLEIEVTGTKFNIEAYEEDNIIRTSLVEGHVKLKVGKQVTYLKAGEQAVFTASKQLEVKTDATLVKDAIGWKDGSFVFKDNTLKEIINELCRWYNLEVQYKGEIPENTYYGIFSRSSTIESILDYLQKQTGIGFLVDGKRIIIQP